jgi:hypothetical protein
MNSLALLPYKQGLWKAYLEAVSGMDRPRHQLDRVCVKFLDNQRRGGALFSRLKTEEREGTL